MFDCRSLEIYITLFVLYGMEIMSFHEKITHSYSHSNKKHMPIAQSDYNRIALPIWQAMHSYLMCHYSNGCISVKIVQPNCSNGFLEYADSRYVNITLVVQNCHEGSKENNAALFIFWLWGSTKNGSEIHRCRFKTSCRVPTMAVNNSSHKKTWLDIVFFLRNHSFPNKLSVTKNSTLTKKQYLHSRLSSNKKYQPSNNILYGLTHRNVGINSLLKNVPPSAETVTDKKSRGAANNFINSYLVNKKSSLNLNRRAENSTLYKKSFQKEKKYKSPIHFLLGSLRKGSSFENKLEEVKSRTNAFKDVSPKSKFGYKHSKTNKRLYFYEKSLKPRILTSFLLKKGVRGKEQLIKRKTKSKRSLLIRAIPRTVSIRATPRLKRSLVNEAEDLAILTQGENSRDKDKISEMIASDFASTLDIDKPVAPPYESARQLRVMGPMGNLRNLDSMVNDLKAEKEKEESLNDVSETIASKEAHESFHLKRLRSDIKREEKQLAVAEVKKDQAESDLLANTNDKMTEVLARRKVDIEDYVKKLYEKLHKLKEEYRVLKATTETTDKGTKRKLHGLVVIDPMWGDWSPWSKCSVDCGEGGFSVRRRECDTLPDVPCDGISFDMRPCNTGLKCEAQWQEWGAWGPCSMTCGKGVRAKSRVCMTGDKEVSCRGESSRLEKCNLPLCEDRIVEVPVSDKRSVVINSQKGIPKAPLVVAPRSVEAIALQPYVWGLWGEWAGCSKNCGEGRQIRVRVCLDESKTTLIRVMVKHCNGGSDAQSRSCMGPCIEAAYVAAAGAGGAAIVDYDDTHNGAYVMEQDNGKGPRVVVGPNEALADASDNAVVVGSANGVPVVVAGAGAVTASDNDDEDSNLSASTILFIILLIVCVILIIIAFCIWFCSRIDDTRFKKGNEPTRPLYDDGNDPFSNGVVSPVYGVIRPVNKGDDQAGADAASGGLVKSEENEDVEEEEEPMSPALQPLTPSLTPSFTPSLIPKEHTRLDKKHQKPPEKKGSFFFNRKDRHDVAEKARRAGGGRSNFDNDSKSSSDSSSSGHDQPDQKRSKKKFRNTKHKSDLNKKLRNTKHKSGLNKKLRKTKHKSDLNKKFRKTKHKSDLNKKLRKTKHKSDLNKKLRKTKHKSRLKKKLRNTKHKSRLKKKSKARVEEVSLKTSSDSELGLSAKRGETAQSSFEDSVGSEITSSRSSISGVSIRTSPLDNARKAEMWIENLPHTKCSGSKQRLVGARLSYKSDLDTCKNTTLAGGFIRTSPLDNARKAELWKENLPHTKSSGSKQRLVHARLSYKSDFDACKNTTLAGGFIRTSPSDSARKSEMWKENLPHTKCSRSKQRLVGARLSYKSDFDACKNSTLAGGFIRTSPSDSARKSEMWKENLPHTKCSGSKQRLVGARLSYKSDLDACKNTRLVGRFKAAHQCRLNNEKCNADYSWLKNADQPKVSGLDRECSVEEEHRYSEYPLELQPTSMFHLNCPLRTEHKTQLHMKCAESSEQFDYRFVLSRAGVVHSHDAYTQQDESVPDRLIYKPCKDTSPSQMRTETSGNIDPLDSFTSRQAGPMSEVKARKSASFVGQSTPRPVLETNSSPGLCRQLYNIEEDNKLQMIRLSGLEKLNMFCIEDSYRENDVTQCSNTFPSNDLKGTNLANKIENEEEENTNECSSKKDETISSSSKEEPLLGMEKSTDLTSDNQLSSKSDPEQDKSLTKPAAKVLNFACLIPSITIKNYSEEGYFSPHQLSSEEFKSQELTDYRDPQEDTEVSSQPTTLSNETTEGLPELSSYEQKKESVLKVMQAAQYYQNSITALQASLQTESAIDGAQDKSSTTTTTTTTKALNWSTTLTKGSKIFGPNETSSWTTGPNSEQTFNLKSDKSEESGESKAFAHDANVNKNVEIMSTSAGIQPKKLKLLKTLTVEGSRLKIYGNKKFCSCNPVCAHRADHSAPIYQGVCSASTEPCLGSPKCAACSCRCGAAKKCEHPSFNQFDISKEPLHKFVNSVHQTIDHDTSVRDRNKWDSSLMGPMKVSSESHRFSTDKFPKSVRFSDSTIMDSFHSDSFKDVSLRHDIPPPGQISAEEFHESQLKKMLNLQIQKFMESTKWNVSKDCSDISIDWDTKKKDFKSWRVNNSEQKLTSELSHPPSKLGGNKVTVDSVSTLYMETAHLVEAPDYSDRNVCPEQSREHAYGRTAEGRDNVKLRPSPTRQARQSTVSSPYDNTGLKCRESKHQSDLIQKLSNKQTAGRPRQSSLRFFDGPEDQDDSFVTALEDYACGRLSDSSTMESYESVTSEQPSFLMSITEEDEPIGDSFFTMETMPYGGLYRNITSPIQCSSPELGKNIQSPCEDRLYQRRSSHRDRGSCEIEKSQKYLKLKFSDEDPSKPYLQKATECVSLQKESYSDESFLFNDGVQGLPSRLAVQNRAHSDSSIWETFFHMQPGRDPSAHKERFDKRDLTSHKEGLDKRDLSAYKERLDNKDRSAYKERFENRDPSAYKERLDILTLQRRYCNDSLTERKKSNVEYKYENFSLIDERKQMGLDDCKPGQTSSRRDSSDQLKPALSKRASNQGKSDQKYLKRIVSDDPGRYQTYLHRRLSDELEPDQLAKARQLSDEHRQDLSVKAIRLSDEHRQDLSARDRLLSEEHRQNLSAKAIRLSDELEPDQLAKANQLSDEHRQDLSAKAIRLSDELEPDQSAKANQLSDEHRQDPSAKAIQLSDELEPDQSAKARPFLDEHKSEPDSCSSLSDECTPESSVHEGSSGRYIAVKVSLRRKRSDEPRPSQVFLHSKTLNLERRSPDLPLPGKHCIQSRLPEASKSDTSLFTLSAPSKCKEAKSLAQSKYPYDCRQPGARRSDVLARYQSRAQGSSFCQDDPGQTSGLKSLKKKRSSQKSHVKSLQKGQTEELSHNVRPDQLPLEERTSDECKLDLVADDSNGLYRLDKEDQSIVHDHEKDKSPSHKRSSRNYTEDQSNLQTSFSDVLKLGEAARHKRSLGKYRNEQHQASSEDCLDKLKSYDCKPDQSTLHRTSSDVKPDQSTLHRNTSDDVYIKRSDDVQPEKSALHRRTSEDIKLDQSTLYKRTSDDVHRKKSDDNYRKISDDVHPDKSTLHRRTSDDVRSDQSTLHRRTFDDVRSDQSTLHKRSCNDVQPYKSTLHRRTPDDVRSDQSTLHKRSCNDLQPDKSTLHRRTSDDVRSDQSTLHRRSSDNVRIDQSTLHRRTSDDVHRKIPDDVKPDKSTLYRRAHDEIDRKTSDDAKLDHSTSHRRTTADVERVQPILYRRTSDNGEIWSSCDKYSLDESILYQSPGENSSTENLLSCYESIQDKHFVNKSSSNETEELRNIKHTESKVRFLISAEQTTDEGNSSFRSVLSLNSLGKDQSQNKNENVVVQTSLTPSGMLSPRSSLHSVLGNTVSSAPQLMSGVNLTRCDGAVLGKGSENKFSEALSWADWPTNTDGCDASSVGQSSLSDESSLTPREMHSEFFSPDTEDLLQPSCSGNELLSCTGAGTPCSDRFHDTAVSNKRSRLHKFTFKSPGVSRRYRDKKVDCAAVNLLGTSPKSHLDLFISGDHDPEASKCPTLYESFNSNALQSGSEMGDAKNLPCSQHSLQTVYKESLSVYDNFSQESSVASDKLHSCKETSAPTSTSYLSAILERKNDCKSPMGGDRTRDGQTLNLHRSRQKSQLPVDDTDEFFSLSLHTSSTSFSKGSGQMGNVSKMASTHLASGVKVGTPQSREEIKLFSLNDTFFYSPGATRKSASPKLVEEDLVSVLHQETKSHNEEDSLQESSWLLENEITQAEANPLQLAADTSLEHIPITESVDNSKIHLPLPAIASTPIGQIDDCQGFGSKKTEPVDLLGVSMYSAPNILKESKQSSVCLHHHLQPLSKVQKLPLAKVTTEKAVKTIKSWTPSHMRVKIKCKKCQPKASARIFQNALKWSPDVDEMSRGNLAQHESVVEAQKNAIDITQLDVFTEKLATEFDDDNGRIYSEDACDLSRADMSKETVSNLSSQSTPFYWHRKELLSEEMTSDDYNLTYLHTSYENTLSDISSDILDKSGSNEKVKRTNNICERPPSLYSMTISKSENVTQSMLNAEAVQESITAGPSVLDGDCHLLQAQARLAYEGYTGNEGHRTTGEGEYCPGDVYSNQPDDLPSSVCTCQSNQFESFEIQYKSTLHYQRPSNSGNEICCVDYSEEKSMTLINQILQPPLEPLVGSGFRNSCSDAKPRYILTRHQSLTNDSCTQADFMETRTTEVCTSTPTCLSKPYSWRFAGEKSFMVTESYVAEQETLAYLSGVPKARQYIASLGNTIPEELTASLVYQSQGSGTSSGQDLEEMPSYSADNLPHQAIEESVASQTTNQSSRAQSSVTSSYCKQPSLLEQAAACKNFTPDNARINVTASSQTMSPFESSLFSTYSESLQRSNSSASFTTSRASPIVGIRGPSRRDLSLVAGRAPTPGISH